MPTRPNHAALRRRRVADDAKRLVEETVAKLGSIDLMVHSAGGPVNGGLLEITPEAWYGAFEVHVHPIFHLCRAAIPHMRKKKNGSIVLISSTAGIRGIRTNVAYQAVKGALPQLTRALAFEFADDDEGDDHLVLVEAGDRGRIGQQHARVQDVGSPVGAVLFNAGWGGRRSSAHR